VSTFDELCGIAGYTRALERQLRPAFDIQVFYLDQYLMRSTQRRVNRLADREIKAICKALSGFDAVNIQLEFGTLGMTQRQIMRRLDWLCRAAPTLSVTFHTILDDEGPAWGDVFALLGQGKVKAARNMVFGGTKNRDLARKTYGLLRRMQRSKPTRVIVHTRRDARMMKDIHRINEVLHHPLAFIDGETATEARAAVSRNDFPLLRQVPPDAKLIGTFGFVSGYKGFETAIEAMRYLPEDHHLLIFGGIHPQTIRRHEPRDPYIDRLLKRAKIGQTILDELRDRDGSTSLALDGSSRELLERHPHDLFDRVHFMGVLGDDDFARAMAICDAVVLPYMEVGQSSSGPIAIALEMGCRIIASRTKTFLQYARYHPDEVEFFDIGNFAELAHRLAAPPPRDPRERRPRFNVDTNRQVYVEANSLRRGPLFSPTSELATANA
jgi:glycosyltransferase involved in cell wall biosynthesis